MLTNVKTTIFYASNNVIFLKIFETSFLFDECKDKIFMPQTV